MAKGEDSLTTNHLDDFRHRSAVDETSDFFFGQCGKGSQFFEDKSFRRL